MIIYWQAIEFWCYCHFGNNWYDKIRRDARNQGANRSNWLNIEHCRIGWLCDGFYVFICICACVELWSRSMRITYASLHFHYAINLSLFVVTPLVNASPISNKIIKSVITIYTISMHLNAFECTMQSRNCIANSYDNLACCQMHKTMYTVVLSTKPFLFKTEC